MKWVSYIIALLLALVTAGVGLFFIGAQEQHEELLTYHLWSTLILRFLFASSLGLVGAGLW
ncbi:hypothetical protein FNT36_06040 [Hymenobacter setariae]|uniref:Uncharacterized protein n=1 Tax=Hymenobacter setariae TaxID=2594794 RepID=A0A558C4S0_9BACT|nr:hypothetical protein [Hymenobacter setariae]TVT43642.1 hypothetical protein FNT36_06040 [Hymenobacter setariae]